MSCLRLLRTSAGRYLVPVGTALAAGRLLLASWSQGSWADTTLKATSMAVLLLPFVMLAGAQDGHRLLRNRAHPSAASSARAPGAVVVHVVAAVSVWGLGGYLLVLVTGYAAPVRLNPIWPPPVPLSWIVAGSGAVVCYAALGVLVGRLAPVLVALATCGVLGFVLPVALGAEVDWTPALFTIANDGFLGGPAAARTTALLLQGLFFGLAALAAVAAAAWSVRRTAAGLAATLVLCLLVSAAGVALATVGRTKTVWLVNSSGPRSCSDDRVVCVWSDHGALTPSRRMWRSRWPADSSTSLRRIGPAARGRTRLSCGLPPGLSRGPNGTPSSSPTALPSVGRRWACRRGRH